MTSVKYIIVSPVKNEEQYLKNTIHSVSTQTVKPALWVIVNDGSADRTGTIAENYAEVHPWIRVVSLPGAERVRGGRVVKVFYEGFKTVSGVDYDYIVKLDGDVTFGPRFFETIFQKFNEQSALGISSGTSHIFSGGRLVEEKSSSGHTLGATKVYRKKCFEDIGGLVPSMGWDGIDEIKARMMGWEAEPVKGLVVVHHRPEGRAQGFFRAGIERGRGAYYMGYHPVFLALRSFKCMFKSPPLLDGLGMLLGYAGSLLGNGERIGDCEFIRFLRKNQLRKMLFMKNRI